MKDRPLPEPAAAASEAYQRSPTLLSNHAPDGLNAVRVWAPDRWRLYIPIVACAAGWIYWLYILAVGRHTVHELCGIGFWVVMTVTFGRILFRPAYLSTDSSGIAITCWPGGSIALRWSEIQAIECRNHDWAGSWLGLRHFGSSETVLINLAGYPSPRAREIARLIRSRAELHRHRTNKNFYYRTEERLPRPNWTRPPHGMVLGTPRTSEPQTPDGTVQQPPAAAVTWVRRPSSNTVSGTSSTFRFQSPAAPQSPAGERPAA